MLIGFRVGSKQFLLTLKDNVKNKGKEKKLFKYASHNFLAGCFIQNNKTFWLIYAWCHYEKGTQKKVQKKIETIMDKWH